MAPTRRLHDDSSTADDMQSKLDVAPLGHIYARSELLMARPWPPCSGSATRNKVSGASGISLRPVSEIQFVGGNTIRACPSTKKVQRSKSSKAVQSEGQRGSGRQPSAGSASLAEDLENLAAQKMDEPLSRLQPDQKSLVAAAPDFESERAILMCGSGSAWNPTFNVKELVRLREEKPAASPPVAYSDGLVDYPAYAPSPLSTTNLTLGQEDRKPANLEDLIGFSRSPSEASTRFSFSSDTSTRFNFSSSVSEAVVYPAPGMLVASVHNPEEELAYSALRAEAPEFVSYWGEVEATLRADAPEFVPESAAYVGARSKPAGLLDSGASNSIHAEQPEDIAAVPRVAVAAADVAGNVSPKRHSGFGLLLAAWVLVLLLLSAAGAALGGRPVSVPAAGVAYLPPKHRQHPHTMP